MLRSQFMRSLRQTIHLSVFCGLVFAFVVVSSAHAQPPAPPADDNDDNTGRVTIDSLEGDGVTTLPETVVTAPSFPREPLTADTIVSDRRTETPRNQVGSSVTVVTEQEIRRRGLQTLNEVLRSVPGVDIAQSGGPGQQSTVFLRGSNGAQTKVLLDGIPLNNPVSPTRAFSPENFALSNVERIEILRGPQSGVYGSDAIGGVINIVTKRGTGAPKLRTTVSGGSFGTYSQQVDITGGSERYWYALSGSWFKTDGFSAVDGRFGATERDGYENGTLSGRTGFLLTDDLDVDVVWRYTDADVDFDSFFPLGDNASNLDTEEFFFRTQLKYRQLDGRLEHRVGYSRTKFKRDDPRTFFGSTSFDGNADKFDYQLSLKTFDEVGFRHRITAGAEHYREAALQGGFAGVAQFNNGVFIENSFAINDEWFTDAVWRYDQFSRSGNTHTYRVTSRYTPTGSGTSFHGSIATGFRAPALNEIAYGFPGFFNPNIRPERSFGWEAGIEQQFFDGDMVLDATYFRNDITDLIIFPPPTFNIMNVSQALTAGVELNGTFRLDDKTDLIASYTNTKAQDKTRMPPVPLVRRARHKFQVGLNRRMLDDRANLSLNLRFIGDRPDLGGVVLDEALILNMAGSIQLTDRVRMFARIDNVTDVEYEEVFGFQTPRLSAYGGFVVEFGGDKN